MSFKVYATDYLVGYGYGAIILSGPLKTRNGHAVEYHAFFSGNISTYTTQTLPFDSETLKGVGDYDLYEIALSEGKEHIYKILSSVSPIQYQAMMAGRSFSFTEKERTIC